MFATLLGGLPLPDGVVHGPEAIELAVRAQEAAGLEPITDGRLGAGRNVLDAWRFAAGLTDRSVKQALPGPYSTGWADASDQAISVRGRRAIEAAERVHAEVDALAANGCPLIEIEETEAHRIGDDEAERALFREVHRIVTNEVRGTHLSLSIMGSAADGAGIETVLAAPYASLAVDLIAGPDNWNLVTRVPRERGIVVGALSGRPVAEAREVLLWGTHYAAASAGRGIDRVGIGSAGSWTSLTWDEAVRRMATLGEVVRLAGLPRSEELTSQLDPRAVSSRRAALGHAAARRPRRPPR